QTVTGLAKTTYQGNGACICACFPRVGSNEIGRKQMAGAMAGSAVLKSHRRSACRGNLRTVTLTINNICQLQCPHCYLNYREQSPRILQDVLALLGDSEWLHLAIVGKEPLANADSVATCHAAMRMCRKKNATVSLITNGIGLDALTPEMLA